MTAKSLALVVAVLLICQIAIQCVVTPIVVDRAMERRDQMQVQQLAKKVNEFRDSMGQKEVSIHSLNEATDAWIGAFSGVLGMIEPKEEEKTGEDAGTR